MPASKKEEDPISQKGSNQYTDPTYNVLQLVNAQVIRLNDLSELDREKNDKIHELNETILNLHVDYMKQLSKAESQRIDAIRAVDVGAVAIANERAVAQASVLANQVSTSADTLRNLVSQTADTTAKTFQQVISPLTERIALLEKSQYESKGLSGLPPEILTRLANLELTRGQGVGRTQGNKDVMDIIKIIIAIAGFIAGLKIFVPT